MMGWSSEISSSTLMRYSSMELYGAHEPLYRFAMATLLPPGMGALRL